MTERLLLSVTTPVPGPFLGAEGGNLLWALVGDIALVMVCKGQPHHTVVPGKGADLIQGGMGVVI